MISYKIIFIIYKKEALLLLRYFQVLLIYQFSIKLCLKLLRGSSDYSLSTVVYYKSSALVHLLSVWEGGSV